MLNGGSAELKGNKIGWWERKHFEREESSDITIVLDDEYSGRPDLVAFDFYNATNLMWLVLQYNNIVDLEEEFVSGKTITIPSVERAVSVFSKSSIRNNT